MRRLTEYTVSAGRRASWRRAASPTTMPSGAKPTMDGSSRRPSRSAMTTGRPVRSSTYATRLFVVPRSMPTMRAMLLLGSLAQRGRQVVDHGAQIGARGQCFLERVQRGRLGGGGGGVPGLAERTGDLRLGVGHPRLQRRALLGQRRARGIVQLTGLRLFQRLLDLEHLGQQRRRRLRLLFIGGDPRPFVRVTPFLEANQ